MQKSIYTGLANGRWHEFSLSFQMGNIGSEISRALSAKESGNTKRMNDAFDRALDLFDLTISDPKHIGRLKEICRAREVVCDFFVGGNKYSSNGSSLNRYFTDFAMVSRKL
ncbi:MAG: hypothetical protein KAS32_30820 [Candidatus Peribacteraceae bacterium]|nr:hypothetical protein [Candidatus Peribacteraceae bacterium]